MTRSCFRQPRISVLLNVEVFCWLWQAAPVTKSILITLARDIDGAQLWAALDEALVPRLKAAGAGRDGDTAVAAFARVFQGRPFKQGTTFLLNWSQPAMLEVSQALPPLLLARSFFNDVCFLKHITYSVLLHLSCRFQFPAVVQVSPHLMCRPSSLHL